MTTCNEIQRILEDPAGHRAHVALYGIVGPDDPETVDRLVTDLAALANGRGGRILIGVGPDGGLADADRLDLQGTEELLDEIRRERISPPLDLRVELLSCPGGQVVVVNVPRQSGGPYAMRSGGAGAQRNRAYAVRSGSGVEPVDDEQLRWLFRHPADPTIHHEFRAALGYLRDSLRPPPMLPQPRCATSYDALLRRLPQTELASVADDPDRAGDLWMELTPYAFAASLATVFTRSWLPRERRDTGGGDGDSPPPSRTVSLAELPAPPKRGELTKMVSSIPGLVSGMDPGEFRLPADAEVQIGVLSHRRKARFTVQNRHFTLQVVWHLAARGSGVPWYGEGDDPAPEVAGPLAWVALDGELILSLDYPDRAVATFDRYVAFAEVVVDHLSAAWDARHFVEVFPEHLLRELCSRSEALVNPPDD